MGVINPSYGASKVANRFYKVRLSAFALNHTLISSRSILNMITQRAFSSSFILSAVLALSACGGNGTSGTVNLDVIAADFSSKISAAFADLTSVAGLNAKALTNLFDDKFLDGGSTKAELVSTLTATSTALGTTPELSLFPLASITNVKLTGCDTKDICTLNGTLTNSDADTTTVDFSTKVIVIGGVVYFYGDQSSTTSI
jgi:hypothetical protein